MSILKKGTMKLGILLKGILIKGLVHIIDSGAPAPAPLASLLQWLIGVDTVVETYGDEEVVNGRFDSNVDDWLVLDSTVSWDAGRAKVTYSSYSQNLYQTGSVPTGEMYTFSVDIDSPVDMSDCYVTIGGGAVQEFFDVATGLHTYQGILEPGTFSQTISIGLFLAPGESAYIDNVSVKEVIPNADYGINIIDSLDEAYVSPSAKIKDVNCLQFGSGSKTISNITFPVQDWYFSVWLYPTAFGFYDEIILTTARQTDTLAGYIALRFIAATLEPACRIQGASFSAGASNTIPLNTWSRVITKRISGDITFEAYDINGTQLFSVLAGNNTQNMENETTPAGGQIELGAHTSGREFSGKVGQMLAGDLEANAEVIPFEEGFGNSYGTGGIDRIFTHSNITWSTGDNIPSWFHLKGGYLAVQGVAPYIPAIAGTYDLPIEQGTAVKSVNNPVYTAPADSSFESQVRYTSTIKVSDSDWRMFLYQRTGTGGTVYMTYQTSTDGITWVKPNLGLVSYSGNTNNNIVAEGSTVAGITDAQEYSATHWLLLTEDYNSTNKLWTIPKDMTTGPVLLKTLSDITSSHEAKTIQKRTDGRYVILGTYGQGNPGMRSTIVYLSDTTDPTGSWTSQGTPPAFAAISVTEQFYTQAISVIDGVWYSIYSDYNGTTEQSIMGLARSDDEGTTWAIVNPLLAPLGADGQFDDEILWGDRMWLDGATYRSYYMGLEDEHYSPTGKDGAIGYVNVDLAVTGGGAGGSYAADGSAITNRGGYVHNGSEVTILESDPAVVPILGVSGTGTASDGDFTYVA